MTGAEPAGAGPGRRRGVIVASIVAVAVAAVVGALVLTSGGDDETTAAGPTTTQVANDAMTRPKGYEPRFEEAECPPATASAAPEATCGNLIVPESRDNPTGRTVSVPVAKLAGPAGGTADPAVILDVNETAATTSLDAATDVYSLGLRGFSGSGDVPLTCPEVQTAWAGTLDVRADDADAMAKRVESADACAARLRAAGVQLEGYTMAEAADDIRDLTVALDLDRVSVAAGGYTTTAAVAWARSNPGSVSSLLLTNPTPPGESVLEDPARAAARSFKRINELCAADASCQAAYPDLDAQFRRRFDDLQSQPRLVSTKSLSGLGPFAVLLDGRRYAAGLESVMRESARLGLVPSAVQGASDELTAAAGIDEDVSFFVGPTSLTAAFLSVTCSYDARLNRTAEISDATMRQFAGANEPTFGRICQSWGVPSEFERLSRPLDLDVPVFLASGGLSVSGVSGWAESMAGGLSDATVVNIPTMSEDLSFAPPPCLRRLRQEFLTDPEQRLDTTGVRREGGPHRVRLTLLNADTPRRRSQMRVRRNTRRSRPLVSAYWSNSGHMPISLGQTSAFSSAVSRWA